VSRNAVDQVEGRGLWEFGHSRIEMLAVTLAELPNA